MDYNKITENVKIVDFCKELELELLHSGTREYIGLTTIHTNRPGMQLTGFFDHFGVERVQLLGEMEFCYLKALDDEQRKNSVDKLFSYAFPCLIISTGLEPLDEIIQAAKKYNRILLGSKKRTSLVAHDIGVYLNNLLAPTETRHGVLIDLYGVGVMITGLSGVGKSETALELVQRGHRLIADDAVVMRLVNNIIIGTAPDIIKHLMEVRGVGIIDLRHMYGVGAIKDEKVIDLVVQLEEWREDGDYDRLGMNQANAEILGKKIPKTVIPVKPGRNIAVILEVAARNYRLRTMGFSALDELDRRMNVK